MTKWEYEILTCKTHRELISMLKTSGKEGWELISVVENIGVGLVFGYLKRPSPQ